MMTKHHNPAPARFTVFTISVDEDTVANIMDGCAYAPDTEFAGDFPDYIPSGKRPQFSQRVKDSAACIAIIDFDRDPERAAQSAEIVHQALAGKIATVAVSNRDDAQLVLQAMRAGCGEFLSRPFDLSQFTAMVIRLQARFAAAFSDAPKNVGNVISFFGVKGGVGATTLAVYLATFLVRQHRKKVLLIDHHHQLGHVCLHLGLKENPYYFDELLRNVDRLDVQLLAGFLTHHPCGLDLLPSPDTCAARYAGNPHDMEQVLDFLRGEYDYVILDSSLEYQDVNSAIVNCSDEVYLVATPDVAALRDLSRHVENFGLDDAVNKEQVESAVRFPVSVTVPNNYVELVRAVNAGEPLSPQRRSEFTSQIGKWTNRVVHAHSNPEAEAPKRKSFAFWR
jgi:pilus assembly protein CpaE